MDKQLLSNHYYQQPHFNQQFNQFSNLNNFKCTNGSKNMQKPVQMINSVNIQNSSSHLSEEQSSKMPQISQENQNIFEMQIDILIEDKDLKEAQKQFFLEYFLYKLKPTKNSHKSSFEETVAKIMACSGYEKSKFVKYFSKEQQKFDNLQKYLEAYEKKCSTKNQNFLKRYLPRIKLIRYGTLAALEIEKINKKFYQSLKHTHTKEKIQGFQGEIDKNCCLIDRKARQIFHDIKDIKVKQEPVLVDDVPKVEKGVQTDYEFKYQKILDILLQSETIQKQKETQQIIKKLNDLHISENLRQKLPKNYLEFIDQNILNFLKVLLVEADKANIIERMKELEVMTLLLNELPDHLN
ncbi:hypothetical protein ABPG72_004676 [Tetrahymena utriculariae]